MWVPGLVVVKTSMEETPVDVILGVSSLELLANARMGDSALASSVLEHFHSLWIVPVVVDGTQQASGDVVVQPPATPILLTQRESVQLGTTDPVNDNFLQTVYIITSGVVSSSVELYQKSMKTDIA